MATGIDNSAEAVSRGPQPRVEDSGSNNAARRDLSGDEQVFAAALKGPATDLKKGPATLSITRTDKPPSAKPQPVSQRGETTLPQPADGSGAKESDALPPDAPSWPEPLTATPQAPAGFSLQETGQPPISSRAATTPPSAAATPTIRPREESLAARIEPNPSNPPAANADREPTKRRSADSKPADDRPDPIPTAPLALGDSILRSLQGRSNTESAPATPPAAPDAAIGEIAEKVASRILVADRSTGAAEVRITLNGSFLNGAEVRVRQDGGRLVVEFTAPSPESQTLLRERGNDLQQALQARLGDAVRVEIRSQEAGRDHPDGRSRQRRFVQDEWETER